MFCLLYLSIVDILVFNLCLRRYVSVLKEQCLICSERSQFHVIGNSMSLDDMFVSVLSLSASITTINVYKTNHMKARRD